MPSLRYIKPPGDEIIVPDPGYPNYLGQIALLRGKAVPVPLREEFGFQLQPEDLEAAITPKTKAIMLNNPSNPTGMVYSRRSWRPWPPCGAKADIYGHLRRDLCLPGV